MTGDFTLFEKLSVTAILFGVLFLVTSVMYAAATDTIPSFWGPVPLVVGAAMLGVWVFRGVWKQ